MDSIGERLKYIRKLHDLNQQQFSLKIGISQGRLSELELGKTYPSTETLISIANQFKVDLNWLILGNSREKLVSNIYFELEVLFGKLSFEKQKEIISFVQFKLRE